MYIIPKRSFFHPLPSYQIIISFSFSSFPIINARRLVVVRQKNKAFLCFVSAWTYFFISRHWFSMLRYPRISLEFKFKYKGMKSFSFSLIPADSMNVGDVGEVSFQWSLKSLEFESKECEFCNLKFYVFSEFFKDSNLWIIKHKFRL